MSSNHLQTKKFLLFSSKIGSVTQLGYSTGLKIGYNGSLRPANNMPSSKTSSSLPLKTTLYKYWRLWLYKQNRGRFLYLPEHQSVPDAIHYRASQYSWPVTVGFVNLLISTKRRRKLSSCAIDKAIKQDREREQIAKHYHPYASRRPSVIQSSGICTLPSYSGGPSTLQDLSQSRSTAAIIQHMQNNWIQWLGCVRVVGENNELV